MNLERLHIVITGGGTGGHLFPGVAVADAFVESNPDNRIIFIGTGNAFETRVLSGKGYEYDTIPSEGLISRGVGRQIVSLAKIPLGVVRAVSILRRFKPDMVIGMGGYSAGPVISAARMMGTGTAIHEQNVIPGVTNRLAAYFVDLIFLSLSETRSYWRTPGVNIKKMRITGNPIRKDIIEHAHAPRSSKDRFNVLIVGGSQGAHGINTAIANCLPLLEKKEAYRFVHLTGEADFEQIKAAYERSGTESKVSPFSNDMAKEYKDADLIICRAGATTLAEVSVMGKGVIFIPFPYATHQHQVLNAQTLVNAGAAEMILQKELSGRRLAERIHFYLTHPQRLQKMGELAKSRANPDAAKTIVRLTQELIGQKRRINRRNPALR